MSVWERHKEHILSFDCSESYWRACQAAPPAGGYEDEQTWKDARFGACWFWPRESRSPSAGGLSSGRGRALTARKFGSTPARLARGEYLVRGVTNCIACHAAHDWTAHDAPILPNTLGAGQDMNFLKGLPGKVYAPNITPDPETGVGNWSDDQLARAIREGVSHDGRALFPFMPYPDFRSMSDEDLASVIVYLRSLPPVREQQPTTELIFPVKYLIRSAPQPLDAPVPEPDRSTPEKRGK